MNISLENCKLAPTESFVFPPAGNRTILFKTLLTSCWVDSAKADFRPFLPQDYPKLSQSYYSLLEVLTQDHMNFIASLEPHVIMYILSSISEGLTALGKHLGWSVGFYHVTKLKERILSQYLKGLLL